MAPENDSSNRPILGAWDGAGRFAIWLHAGTIFLSAFLLFQLQSILTRLILPWFGRAAAVWTISLAFYQLAYLFGNLYAHLLIRRLPARFSGRLQLSHQKGSIRLFAYVIVGGAQIRQSMTSSTTSTGSITFLGISGTSFTSTTTTVTQTSNAGLSMKGTGLAFAMGGGIDWFHGPWALRIVQMEYLHTGGDGKTSSLTSVACTQPGGASCGSTNSTLTETTSTGTTSRKSDDVRLATDLVFRFGKR